MVKNELPKSVDETQVLIDEILEFAERETDREKRRELLLLSLELKKHLLKLRKNMK